MSASRDLYRTLVPAHSGVADDTVDTFLELATRRHTVGAWGMVYPEAMVWWAAHQIETLPGSGASGPGASEVGQLTSQTDGDLSRSYAAPVVTGNLDDDLRSTWYGRKYLDLRQTRAASAPTVAGVGW